MDDTPQEWLDAIADEVLDALELENAMQFVRGEANNYAAGDAVLQQVLARADSLTSQQLAMYLRSAFFCRQHLPTWRPLRAEVIGILIERGDPIEDYLIGLLGD